MNASQRDRDSDNDFTKMTTDDVMTLMMSTLHIKKIASL